MKVLFTCAFVLFGFFVNAQSHNLRPNSLCKYAPKPAFNVEGGGDCAACRKENEKERAARKAEDVRVAAKNADIVREKKAAAAAAEAVAAKERVAARLAEQALLKKNEVIIDYKPTAQTKPVTAKAALKGKTIDRKNVVLRSVNWRNAAGEYIGHAVVADGKDTIVKYYNQGFHPVNWDQGANRAAAFDPDNPQPPFNYIPVLTNQTFQSPCSPRHTYSVTDLLNIKGDRVFKNDSIRDITYIGRGLYVLAYGGGFEPRLTDGCAIKLFDSNTKKVIHFPDARVYFGPGQLGEGTTSKTVRAITLGLGQPRANPKLRYGYYAGEFSGVESSAAQHDLLFYIGFETDQYNNNNPTVRFFGYTAAHKVVDLGKFVK